MATPVICSSSSSLSAHALAAVFTNNDVNDGLVPGEERAVRAWLVEQGFEPEDLRNENEIGVLGFFKMVPMAAACSKGELNVCKWLHDHGAAGDISKPNSIGWTPMIFACENGHLSVCEWLLEVGAAVDITRASNIGYTPMFMACSNGHLSVCEWLYKVGADADVTRAANIGYTPMHVACWHGHLSVCEWLFRVGADGDVSRADNDGHTPLLSACGGGYLGVCKWLFDVGAHEDVTRASHEGTTPMHWACMNGHLHVCEWLFKLGADDDVTRANVKDMTPMYYACENDHLPVCEWLFTVGAAEDITKACNYGWTPMRECCHRGHLLVCEWLVLNGAMNRPVPSTAAASEDNDGMNVDSDEDYGHDDASQKEGEEQGHVDQAVVRREVPSDCRPALLTWAQGVVATHHAFFRVVLRGSVKLPHRRTSPRRRCHLPKLPRDELERVGSFLGVEMGRRLRNVREFAEELSVLAALENATGATDDLPPALVMSDE